MTRDLRRRWDGGRNARAPPHARGILLFVIIGPATGASAEGRTHFAVLRMVLVRGIVRPVLSTRQPLFVTPAETTRTGFARFRLERLKLKLHATENRVVGLSRGTVDQRAQAGVAAPSHRGTCLVTSAYFERKGLAVF